MKKIYGLVGYPVKHSLSPVMHNAAFKAMGIDAEYRLFEIKPEELENFLSVDSLKGENIFGLNVTIPYKVKAREILEKYSSCDSASLTEQDLYYVKLSGAINTIRREGEKVKYWNTDAVGFLRAVKEELGFNPNGKNVLLIGCGGAGRVIIPALSWIDEGANKIYVNDASVEAVNSAQKYFLSLPQKWLDLLKQKIEFISQEEISIKIKNCHLLVNASPVGMKEGDSSIIDKILLRRDLFVYDIVYNRETQLIKDAKSVGCVARSGLSMLLYQGVAAFEHWTGQKAPVEIMREALTEALNKC